MDLGTANTIITSGGKIVVDEPSVVALDRRTDKMIAVGEKAKLMHEKTHENIRTIRPLRDGVIADFYACEQMIRGLIKMVNTRHRLFSPSLRMVIGVPSGSTEVELRAVRDSAEHAGGRDVYLIFEPMAAAIGIGIDVEAPEGNMIVDIGGGSTEIAVISLGGISIRPAPERGVKIEIFIRTHSLLLGHQTRLVATGKETLELLLLFGKNLVILAAAGDNQQRSKQNMETDFRHTIAQI